jgi:hypothetical protein
VSQHAEASAPSTNNSSKKGRFQGAAGLVALILIFFGVCYFFYVRHKTAYFAARNLRIISTVSSQLEGGVATSRKVKKTEDIPAEEVALAQELGLARPALEDGKIVGVRFRTIAERICAQSVLTEFDDVVIANTKGQAVWTCRGAAQILSLDKLPVHEGWRKAGAALDYADLQRAVRITRTFIGGSPYRVFSQPLQVVMKTTGPDDPPNWVVAGFITDTRFNHDSLTVSYTLLIALLALLVLAVLSLPYLRMALIGELQRVRLTDVLLLGICTLFGVAILTLVLLDTISYQLMRGVADKQLRNLASDMKRHLLSEIGQAEGVLNQLDEVFPFKLEKPRPLTLTEFVLPSIQTYPHFDTFYRVDRTGMQVSKGSTSHPNEYVSVGDRLYFQNVRNGRYTGGPVTIQSIRSITTGVTQTVISKRSMHYIPENPDLRPMVAALAFPMRSLIDPTIAAGYKFAVIDASGNVLFHSDSQRNTFENFFAETDANPALRAAVFGRQAEIVNLRYWGTDHRAFATPVEGTPWTLVTFRSKQLIRALNVETIIIAVMFLVVYAVICGLVLATVAVVWPAYRAPWLWFDKENVYDYRRLIYSYVAFGLSLVGSIYLFKPRPLVVVAFLTPVMASLVTYIRLRRVDGVIAKAALITLACFYSIWIGYVYFDNGIEKHIEQDVVLDHTGVMFWVLLTGTAGVLAAILPTWRRERSRQDIRRHLLVPGYAYGWAATLLLAVMSILPTAAFFKAAFKIETESLVKFGQFELVEQFKRRHEQLQERKYAMQADSADEPEVMKRIETLIKRRYDDGLDLYYRFFFDTELVRALPRFGISRIHKGLRFFPSRFIEDSTSAGIDEAPVPAFLERLLPHYSDESVYMRELLHSKTDQGTHTSTWDRLGSTLRFRLASWPQPRQDVVYVWSQASRIFDLPYPLRPRFVPEARAIQYAEPAGEYPAAENDPEGFAVKMGFLIFGIVAYVSVIIWAVRFINERVFLVDVVEPLWLKPKPGEKIGPALGGNLLIFTNNVNRTLSSVARESFIRVSVNAFKDVQSEKFWRDMMTKIDISPEGNGVLIDDFDDKWDDTMVRAALLRFIDIVSRVHHRNVVIVTETSPWILFGEIEREEAARWASILGSFTVRIDDGTELPAPVRKREYGKPLGDSLDEILAFFMRAAEFAKSGRRSKMSLRQLTTGVKERIATRAKLTRQYVSSQMDFRPLINGSDEHTDALIDGECCGSQFLVQLGAELKQQKAVRGKEQLYDEIGERAASYYAALWARSSGPEKIVLQHVARDGFANVNDRHILRRLLARGVVRRCPHFTLLNETFRRFVLCTPRCLEVEAIHAHTAVSTWDKIENPLMAGLFCAAIFFVATQRDLFDSAMTLVTALATGIPTLVRVAGFFAEPRTLVTPRS